MVNSKRADSSFSGNYTDDELLMLSGLQHVAFCKRQWALIHLEKQWRENYHTARGEVFHERAHLAGYSTSGSVRSMRAVKLVSYRLGLRGEADVVEFWEDDGGGWAKNGKRYSVRPVEYKVGKAKSEDWDRVQVCAQALCLEEMYDCTVDEGVLFYGKTRRREVVPLSPSLRARVEEAANEIHELFEARKTPNPTKLSRCSRCSLNDICMPKATAFRVESYWKKEGLLPR